MWTVIDMIFVQLRIPDWIFEMFWLLKYFNEPRYDFKNYVQEILQRCFWSRKLWTTS